MTQLYKVSAGTLEKVARKRLELENHLQKWVAEDPRIVGLDAIVIGEKVLTAHGKEIDILAMDEEGGLIIIELKRDRTPREVIAQALDYASWVRTLTTAEVYEICARKAGRQLVDLFQSKFGGPIPDTLNSSHQMLIVASEFDEASKRIVEYLSEEYDVGINASFFSVFESEGTQWLTTDFLLDQDEVAERATKKARAPWTGVTGGSEDLRPWHDMKNYGFLTASGGRWYSDRLNNVSVGDPVFHHQSKTGYLGYGRVTSPRVLASEFKLPNGKMLTEVLSKPYLTDNANDPELAAYVICINWIKTFDRANAKSFRGMFASTLPVSKVYKQDTADFLTREFGLTDEAGGKA